MADNKKEVPYTITRPCLVGGERKEIGSVVLLQPGTGNYLVALNKAVKGEQKIAAPKKDK